MAVDAEGIVVLGAAPLEVGWLHRWPLGGGTGGLFWLTTEQRHALRLRLVNG